MRFSSTVVVRRMLMSLNSSKHISLPKTFSLGDVDEWFSHFEICCKTNKWNGTTKAAKLPTLLEGEALAVWLELSEEDKEDYSKAKRLLKASYCQPFFQRWTNLSKDQCSLVKLYPYSYTTSSDCWTRPSQTYCRTQENS